MILKIIIQLLRQRILELKNKQKKTIKQKFISPISPYRKQFIYLHGGGTMDKIKYNKLKARLSGAVFNIVRKDPDIKLSQLELVFNDVCKLFIHKKKILNDKHTDIVHK